MRPTRCHSRGLSVEVGIISDDVAVLGNPRCRLRCNAMVPERGKAGKASAEDESNHGNSDHNAPFRAEEGEALRDL